ncbi:MAG TPA: YDG domain-containing protein [Opitutaceae bacterium]|nr:YDG domain-containing protein [Opitutaceae bacterium]
MISAVLCFRLPDRRLVRQLTGGALFPRVWIIVVGVFLGQAASSAVTAAPETLPTGGRITAGAGDITQSGNLLVIRQDTAKLVANWNTFAIGSAAVVQFHQPDSTAIALNRVTGGDPSQILGTLNANGRVFLLNPAGIVFGATAHVNVGSLVASTLSLSDADFLAGRNSFTSSGATGRITNEGAITAAPGGVIAFLAPVIRNDGTLTAPGGDIALAAGDQVDVDFAGDGRLRIRVDRSTIEAEIANHGLIKADAGSVLMTANAAANLTRAVVNNTGLVEASTVANVNGRIVLTADLLSNTGTIDASGTTGGDIAATASYALHAGTISARGTAGAGGTILAEADRNVQTSSARFDASGATAGGQISLLAGNGQYDGLYSSATATARGATGGTITLAGRRIDLRGATLDASGTAAGGSLRIGGELHGGAWSDPITGRALTNAAVTDVSPGNTLDASATAGDGTGGRIIVWSDEQTYFYGAAKAQGTGRGAGGFIEVSGKDRLQYGGTADASSAGGAAGTVLFDPKDIVIDDAGSGGVAYTAFTNPNPGADTQFGTYLATLANGNMVATDPYATAAGQTHAGAAYLFEPDGTLISTLTGSHANDQIGFDLGNWAGGTTVLTNDNFVVSSPAWNGGRGAATWGNGTTGVSGLVSSSNSLVGSQAGDQVGSGGYGALALSNGNYVIASPNWSDGATTAVGAATWGDGTAGATGTISTANSLIGSSANDSVGGDGIVALTGNGNYVVLSSSWDNTALGVADAGAATWGDGSIGMHGTISSANSLVGDYHQDSIGIGSATALTNGNYVVSSYYWHNAAGTEVGAATWVNGATGQTSNGVNTISSANSLVGSSAGDEVADGGIAALANGNYVVVSFNWSSANPSVGAVTWGNGATGTAGAVGAANSLLGSRSFDIIGSGGITVLSNGNYVVLSPYWDSGTSTNTGAATWQDGATGGTRLLGAAISSANSLVGSANNDLVGRWGTALLLNGNYVVGSPQYNSGAGAATWGDGTTGVVGTISAANSLIGSSSGIWDGTGFRYYGGDEVGDYVVALTNGNYVVSTLQWNSARGSATWGDGTTGVVGTISAANSLIGSTAGTFTPGDTLFTGGDKVGSVVNALANGNYVVRSYDWSDGALSKVGAVTWADGTTGITGTVSAANSLIGSTAGDRVGFHNVLALANGNYVIGSPFWDNGADADAGAATWADGTTGLTGAIDSTNSLIGTAGQQLGGYLRAGTGDTFGVGDSVNYWGIGIYSVGPNTYGGGRSFADNPATSATLTSSQLTAVLNTGSALVLQANNDITITSAITVNNASGDGGALTLQAGRSILLNNSITTDNGALTLVANETTAAGVVDAQRDAGAAVITMAGSTSLNAGSGAVSITLKDGAGRSNTTSGDITLQGVTAGSLSVTNNGPTAGSDIVASGALVVAGTTSLTAETADHATRYDISATHSANDFTGAVSLVGRTITLRDASALTLGTVAATGSVDVATFSGDLTVSGNITTSSTAADAVVLNAGRSTAAGTATGGNIVLSGSPTIVTGSGGFATLYTGSVGGSTGLTTLVGSGSGRFRYASDETTTNYTTALTAGLNVVYRERPILTVTPGSETGTYGNAVPTFTPSYGSFVNGDITPGTVTGTAAWTLGGATSTAGHLVVGSHEVSYSSGLVSSLGYGFADNTASFDELTVAARSLAVTGLTASDRGYDATTTAILGGTATITALGADIVTLGGTATGTFADKNVGTGKSITVTGNTISGTDAANYSLVQQTGLSADITPATLTVSFTGVDKTYDATTSATVTTTDDRLGSDVLTINRSVSFLTKDAATGKTVAISAVSLSGTDAANYSLASTSGSTTADITPATLTVSFSGVNKVYDATTAATVTTTDNRLGSDTLTINRSASFLTKDAASGKTVSVSAVSLSGTDAANYSLASTSGSTTADITPATLTVSFSGVNKVYDATTAATVTTADDRLDSDVLTINRAASFLTKDVASGKTVTVSGVSLSGTDAANYSLASTSGSTTAAITPATLTVSFTGVDKVYDATTAATVTTTDDRLGSDSFTINRAASFLTKDAASGKTVTISAVSLSGTDAANYSLASTSGSTTANITPRTLTITYSAAGKVYDGTSTATLTGSVLSGLVGAETVVATNTTATFDTKDVGTGKTVTVSGIALTDGANGGRSANYQITPTATTAAAITPATLTYVADSAEAFSPLHLPTFTGTVTGFAASDTLVNATTGTPLWSSAITTGSRSGTYAINGSGLRATNYVFVQAPGNATALLLRPAIPTFTDTPRLEPFIGADGDLLGEICPFESGMIGIERSAWFAPLAPPAFEVFEQENSNNGSGSETPEKPAAARKEQDSAHAAPATERGTTTPLAALPVSAAGLRYTY